ncbi:carbohydrate-binding module family 1 protein, partial [Serendipita vermifera MAFF 305830]
ATTSTTKASTSTTKTSTSTAAGSTGTAPVYGQCGGASWTGPTVCASGSTCTFSNTWYSQCIPS